MGVVNLFTELADYSGVIQNWTGANEQLVAEMCGQTLAIDTSVWIFQCSQQQDLKDAIYDEHARVLYTMIHRIISLLRHGVTPVFVLEGDTPEAKMGRLQQRSLAKGLGGMAGGNRRGGRHDALGRRVVQLLDLMGLPHVDAPGEAEAMCAALVAAGLADAVVSSDVDALLFGAPRQYRECRMQFDTPRHTVVERVDPVAAARSAFGLTQPGGGCALALQTVAVLCGCDYSVAGGRGVGVKGAMGAVQQLTRGRQSDAHVPGELLRLLRTGPDPAVMELKACSGCKTCGHEKHGRKPCEQCGPGPCRPKAPGAGCSCRFHSSEPERVLMRVISRAVSTSPSFAADCEAALAAFAAEAQRARREAVALRGRGGLGWRGRPDVDGVFALMHPLLGGTSSDPNKLLWTHAEVRDKLRPVLMEWDMRQGPNPPSDVAAQVQFRPVRIKQEAAKDGGTWAYLVEFERLGDDPDAEFDREQMRSTKLVKGRHVRKTLVERLWPQLLSRREEEAQAKLSQQASKGARKAAGAPRGKRGAAAAAVGSGSATTGGVTVSAGVRLSGSPLASTPNGTGGSGGASGSAKSASRTASRSGLSSGAAGSREVMQRFLAVAGRGGGAAAGGGGAAGGGQQAGEGPSQRERAAGGGGGYGGGYGGAYGGARDRGPVAMSAAAGAAADVIGSDSDSDSDGEGLILTQHAPPALQRRQQPAAGAAGSRAAACAGGGNGVGPSHAGTGGQVGQMLPPRAAPRAPAAAAARAAAARAPIAAPVAAPRVARPLAKTQYSCSDGEDGDGDDDDACNIPDSMEALLAQVGAGAGRTARADPPAAAAAAAAAGGGAGARPGAAAAAGSAHEWPFRPQPTGPGPGRGEAGAGAGSGSAGAAGGGARGNGGGGGGGGGGAGAGGRAGAASTGAGARTGADAGAAGGGGGGGGAAAGPGSPPRSQAPPHQRARPDQGVVEVMDLTDSPAPAPGLGPGPHRQEHHHQQHQQQQHQQQSPMGRTGSTSTGGAAAVREAAGRQGSGEQEEAGAGAAPWGVGSSTKPLGRPPVPHSRQAAAAGGHAAGVSDGARRSLFHERGTVEAQGSPEEEAAAAAAAVAAAGPSHGAGRARPGATQSGSSRGARARSGVEGGAGGAGPAADAPAGAGDSGGGGECSGGGGGGATATGESPSKRQRSIGSTIDNPSNTTTRTGGSNGGAGAGSGGSAGGGGGAAGRAGAGAAAAAPIPVPGRVAARRPVAPAAAVAAAAHAAVDLTFSSDEEDKDGVAGDGSGKEQGAAGAGARRVAAGRKAQGAWAAGACAAPPPQQQLQREEEQEDGDAGDDRWGNKEKDEEEDDDEVIIVESQ